MSSEATAMTNSRKAMDSKLFFVRSSLVWKYGGNPSSPRLASSPATALVPLLQGPHTRTSSRSLPRAAATRLARVAAGTAATDAAAGVAAGAAAGGLRRMVTLRAGWPLTARACTSS